jgi:predicted dehydrogenase
MNIGVGCIGQGEAGRFHLERFRISADCRCEAVWFSPKDLTVGNPARLAAHSVASAHAISSNSSISLVVIDVQSFDGLSARQLASECLHAGQHVIIGFQAFDNPDALVELADVARRADRQLFVPTLHRWESSFLGVQSVVASGCLGELTKIRRISRAYVPEELSRPQQIATDFNQSLDHLWFEMLDELLQFLPLPARVTSASAESAWDSISGAQIRTGRAARLVFENGCVADLELNRRCLAPLETGWILEGELGGFADRKRFRATPDFEMVDVPVEFPLTNQNGFYDAVLSTIQDGTSFPVTLDSVLRVLKLMMDPVPAP